MGEAKRWKQINPQGFGIIISPDAIVLGQFMDSSKIKSISQKTLKNSGIVDAGICVPFVIETFGLMGLAYPYLVFDSKKIYVSIAWAKSPKCKLSSANASKKCLSFEKAVIEKVVKAYVSSVGEVVTSL